MREVLGWDEYYMEMAFAARLRSKDPSTQVGAYIVDRFGSPISAGFNGFLPGFPDTVANWERPAKYDFVVHAEMNAVAHAARRVLEGSTAYVTTMPCDVCMKSLISAGVSCIVHGPRNDRWAEAHDKAAYLAEQTRTTLKEM
jgi:dCMP deaminase